MAKVKAFRKAAKKGLDYAQTKGAQGAGIVAAEKALDAIDNPYISAAEGAIMGAYVAGPIGAVAGGLMGYLLADEPRITPYDMVAIPAYQYASMLAGMPPTHQIFIKEGELIAPILPTDAMESSAVLGATEAIKEKKPRKLTKWQRYMKSPKNKIFFKSGKKKGQLNLKAMGKAYRKGGK
jgi:hypothetical protein